MKPDYRFRDVPLLQAGDVDEMLVLLRRLVVALEKLAKVKDAKR